MLHVYVAAAKAVMHYSRGSDLFPKSKQIKEEKRNKLRKKRKENN